MMRMLTISEQLRMPQNERYFDSPKIRAKYSFVLLKSKKISNDQELKQSNPTSCPQNQKGNN